MLMRATSLCNVNFPISKQGNNIRHHVPDKYYNSLYSWDSGFIGLGFLELDKTRAIENLNVYVTEPEDEENAFLLYGTPLPVQAYLYAEIWNRHQDKEMLEFFYPRLRKFYNFIAGHVPTSTYRKAKSDLLCSWDYFYNSGGWDDYPPQWYVYKTKAYNCIPVVTTAHAIRFAKILRQAAELLNINDDKAVYDSDIEALRSNTDLDTSRHPSFPDDIQIQLVQDGRIVEAPWARCSKLDRDTGFMYAKLINEPHNEFGFHMDDEIPFKVIEAADGNLLCINLEHYNQ
jgi:hypothetical protein